MASLSCEPKRWNGTRHSAEQAGLVRPLWQTGSPAPISGESFHVEQLEERGLLTAGLTGVLNSHGVLAPLSITDQSLVTLVGTADHDGGSVDIYLDGAAVPAGSAAIDNFGEWSFTFADDLAEGEHIVRLVDTDDLSETFGVFDVDLTSPALTVEVETSALSQSSNTKKLDVTITAIDDYFDAFTSQSNLYSYDWNDWLASGYQVIAGSDDYMVDSTGDGAILTFSVRATSINPPDFMLTIPAGVFVDLAGNTSPYVMATFDGINLSVSQGPSRQPSGTMIDSRSRTGDSDGGLQEQRELDMLLEQDAQRRQSGQVSMGTVDSAVQAAMLSLGGTPPSSGFGGGASVSDFMFEELMHGPIDFGGAPTTSPSTLSALQSFSLAAAEAEGSLYTADQLLGTRLSGDNSRSFKMVDDLPPVQTFSVPYEVDLSEVTPFSERPLMTMSIAAGGASYVGKYKGQQSTRNVISEVYRNGIEDFV